MEKNQTSFRHVEEEGGGGGEDDDDCRIMLEHFLC
jgi:hypothetical protein